MLANLVNQATDLNDYVQGLTDEALQQDCYCNMLLPEKFAAQGMRSSSIV
ncbi:hypothetical protein [Paraflavitalea speifideaquila]|nr:hypothetical protein [Paraflavitalea speifideiaquila]